VQLFHGKFYSCNDKSVPDRAACTGTFVENGQVIRLESSLLNNDSSLLRAQLSVTCRLVFSIE
jgi:hypothetical protein